MQVIGDLRKVRNARIAQFQDNPESQFIGNLEEVEGADVIQSVGDNARELESLLARRDDVATAEAILQIINQEMDAGALNAGVIEKAVKRALSPDVPEQIRRAVEDAANAITIVAGGFTLTGACAPIQLGIAMPFICLVGGLMTSGIARKCHEKIKELLGG